MMSKRFLSNHEKALYINAPIEKSLMGFGHMHCHDELNEYKELNFRDRLREMYSAVGVTPAAALQQIKRNTEPMNETKHRSTRVNTISEKYAVDNENLGKRNLQDMRTTISRRPRFVVMPREHRLYRVTKEKPDGEKNSADSFKYKIRSNINGSVINPQKELPNREDQVDVLTIKTRDMSKGMGDSRITGIHKTLKTQRSSQSSPPKLNEKWTKLMAKISQEKISSSNVDNKIMSKTFLQTKLPQTTIQIPTDIQCEGTKQNVKIPRQSAYIEPNSNQNLRSTKRVRLAILVHQEPPPQSSSRTPYTFKLQRKLDTKNETSMVRNAESSSDCNRSLTSNSFENNDLSDEDGTLADSLELDSESFPRNDKFVFQSSTKVNSHLDSVENCKSFIALDVNALNQFWETIGLIIPQEYENCTSMKHLGMIYLLPETQNNVYLNDVKSALSPNCLRIPTVSHSEPMLDLEHFNVFEMQEIGSIYMLDEFDIESDRQSNQNDRINEFLPYFEYNTSVSENVFTKTAMKVNQVSVIVEGNTRKVNLCDVVDAILSEDLLQTSFTPIVSQISFIDYLLHLGDEKLEVNATSTSVRQNNLEIHQDQSTVKARMRQKLLKKTVSTCTGIICSQIFLLPEKAWEKLTCGMEITKCTNQITQKSLLYPIEDISEVHASPKMVLNIYPHFLLRIDETMIALSQTFNWIQAYRCETFKHNKVDNTFEIKKEDSVRLNINVNNCSENDGEHIILTQIGRKITEREEPRKILPYEKVCKLSEEAKSMILGENRKQRSKRNPVSGL